MKQFLTLMAILAMAVPALGAGYADTFDNGTFDLGLETPGTPGLGWNLIYDGTYTFSIYDVPSTTDDELELTAPFPPSPGAQFVGGVVGATAAYTNTVVWSTVNITETETSDQDVIGRLNTTTMQAYSLNYDPNGTGGLELVYVDLLDQDGDTDVSYDLHGFDVPEDSPGSGDGNYALNLKLNILTASTGEVYLVGQAWSEDWSELLSEGQCIVDGVNPTDGSDGYVPPVLPGGGAGLGAIVNSNLPGPLDTRMDDWGARPGLHGDFDLDGDVDVSDLGTLATNYGTLVDMMWSNGDANLDYAVDVSDLGILATNYGAVVSSAAAVPEPATLSLLALAAMSLLLIRRR